MQTYHRCQINRRRNGLPLETICDIFFFLPVKNLLACNWTCLRLFCASQIIYRPLQRPCQQRIIKHLAITFNIDHNCKPFASALFQLCLLENGVVYVRKCSCKCVHTACKTKPAIHRPYTDECWPSGSECWPTEPQLVQSLPAVGLPSDIVTIERIDLSLSCDEQRQCNYASKVEGNVPCVVSIKCHSFQLFFLPFKLEQSSKINVKMMCEKYTNFKGQIIRLNDPILDKCVKICAV